MVSSVGKLSTLRYRHYMPVLLVLSVSAAFLFFAWQALERHYQQRLREYFEFEVERITSNISERMALHALTLRSAAGVFAASNEVSRADWRAFVEMLGLDQNHPGVQGVGYAQWIPANELQSHILQIRSQGFPDYVVAPATPRPHYSSIVYLEPFYGRNLRAFGFDMFSEPVRREAMERARDSGDLAYSGKVTLVQDSKANPQAGMLAFFPVYRHGSIPQTPEQRRIAIQGWVYIPYRMNDLLRAILGKQLSALRLEIFDSDRTDAESLLYDSSDTLDFQQQSLGFGHLRLERRLELAGRHWTLRFTELAGFSKASKLEPPWGEFLAAAFISFLPVFFCAAYIKARRSSLIALHLTESLKQSEHRFRSLFENSPVAYMALDRHGCLLDANPQLCALLDYPGDELIGKKLPDFLVDDADAGADFGLKLQMLNHYGVLECELTLRRKSGGTITVILDGRLQSRKSGPAIIHCILTNITERKRAEGKLQLAARVFADAHEGITITDADGIIIDANPTFCAITGYPRDEVIGRNHNFLKSGKHDAEFYKNLWQTLQTEGCWQGEIWNRKKNGELYVELLTISAMRNQKGEAVNYVGLFSDITQSKLHQQALEEMAHHDPLTHLPNRTLFTDRFQQAMARCKRDNSLLGVVYMDLDGFKQINDNLGHEAGDQLLVEVAARLRAGLREEDTVCRLGGDEFAVLMCGVESKQQCIQALERIHQNVARSYPIAGQQVQVGVSSGVTIYPYDPSNPDYLLRHADEAMYIAKQQGRNRFEFYQAGCNGESVQPDQAFSNQS
ncbi:CHASE domain-containing protein [Methylomonas sp. EFPC3]|uniref:sensor domain-containing diguanylate cyclase n=1 Tax=Methylomonas sp. EFPC3 TaxID=3021710 RepID=UPI0024163167|nr:CHASE domain-containing protein [Methylomonas sp. EFPC3]WFP48753.1 CHASE domain-containing protein [Methylomonas sp. EFPC3]